MSKNLQHEELADAAASEAEAGSFSKAAQLFQAAMLASPDSSAAAAYSEQLAQCLMELDQDEAAVNAAAAAVRLRPKASLQLPLVW
jgi:thioredoxin-like negative regulator of GroEL